MSSCPRAASPCDYLALTVSDPLLNEMDQKLTSILDDGWQEMVAEDDDPQDKEGVRLNDVPAVKSEKIQDAPAFWKCILSENNSLNITYVLVE
jgi:hypothetical protein